MLAVSWAKVPKENQREFDLAIASKVKNRKPEENNKSLVTDTEGFFEGPSPCWLVVVFAGAIVFAGGGGLVEGGLQIKR